MLRRLAKLGISKTDPDDLTPEEVGGRLAAGVLPQQWGLGGRVTAGCAHSSVLGWHSLPGVQASPVVLQCTSLGPPPYPLFGFVCACRPPLACLPALPDAWQLRALVRRCLRLRA